MDRPGVIESLLGALALLLYARSLTAGFVYDDRVIFEKPWLPTWENIPKLFTQDLILDHASNFYRPLAVLWHGVAYRILGTNAIAWHLVSIGLHVICVVLVFRLVCKLIGDHRVAALAAAIFAVHPSHVEVVTWVSDAGDLLMTAFTLISALALLNWLKSGSAGWWFASWLSAFAACFVKETGVLVPAMLLVLALGAPGRMSRQAIFITALSFCASACGYLVIRNHVLHGFSHPLSNVSNREMVLTLPAALWFYVSHLLLPVNLSPTYPLAFVSNWRSAAFVAPLLALAVSLIALIWLYPRLRDHRIFWFCAVWIGVPLVAPLYVKLFPEFELVHDRYLFIPTIGFAVALAVGIAHLASAVPSRLAGAARMLSPLLVIAAGLVTISYQGVWQSDLTLFQRAMERTPRNARALVNLGVAKLEQGDYGGGTAMLKRALEIQPNNAFALFDLGNAALRHDDAGTAESYFHQALALEKHFKWWMLLGNAKFKLGKLDQAEGAVRQALAMDPAGIGAHSLLGGLRLAQGDPASAIREFRAELQLNPGDASARELLELAQEQLREQRNRDMSPEK